MKVTGTANNRLYFDGVSAFTGEIKNITIEKIYGNIGICNSMNASAQSTSVPE